MIGYNTLYKSMNGIRVLSDGVSFISDGQAQHDDIIYNNFMKSNDGKTIINNNNINTDDVNCTNLNCENLTTQNINSNNINSHYLKIYDVLGNNIFIVDGITANKIYTYFETQFNSTLSVVNSDIHQTQTGKLYQQGTGENYLKDTYVNGYVKVGSNLIQTGGSSELLALTVDTITQRPDKGITQSGNVSNNFGGTTQMKNLVITDSIIFPSNVEIPQTTTSDDIIMNSDSVITQDITTITTKFNNFRDTRTLNLMIDGNITQIRGNALTTLKNLIIQGLTTLQGDITQTAGTTILKTLRCNNITLNDDQIITLSGSGYITQSGTGTNILNTINLNNNSNIIFNGNGIINQPLNGTNILSHFRSAGFGIIGGRNNTTYTNYQNIQNNNGLQIQFNRDNSSQYSFLMNNRGTGGNGGFRFQRYVGGVYLDEPLIIDDNITMNKNLSIPSGSISCSSATIGNISQDEFNCLDGCNQNINNKFMSLDSQISNLSSSGSNNTLSLTGISYNSSADTTNIDNNLFITSGKNLLIGTTNILTNLNNNNTNITTLQTITNGITYDSVSDTTTIDNNLTVNKTLKIGSMDVKAEITALTTSFTTGQINSTNLTTSNLTVNNNSRFGSVGGSTYLKNDLRLCNISNKSDETNYTQIYQDVGTLNIVNVVPNAIFNLFGRNQTNTANNNYLTISSSSFNVKNTPLIVDTVSTFNNNVNIPQTATIENINVNTLSSTPFKIANNIQNIQVLTPYNVTNNNQSYNVISLSVQANYAKDITYNTSISRYRNGMFLKNGSLSTWTITETLSSITCNIYKNGQLFLSNVPINNSATLPMTHITSCPGTVAYTTFQYDIFYLSLTVTFRPSFESTNNNYDIAFVCNFSTTSSPASMDLINANYYRFNTDENSYYSSLPSLQLTTTLSNTYVTPSITYQENPNQFLTPSNYLVMVDNMNVNNIRCDGNIAISNDIDISNNVTCANATINDTLTLKKPIFYNNYYPPSSASSIGWFTTGSGAVTNYTNTSEFNYKTFANITIANQGVYTFSLKIRVYGGGNTNVIYSFGIVGSMVGSEPNWLSNNSYVTMTTPQTLNGNQINEYTLTFTRSIYHMTYFVRNGLNFAIGTFPYVFSFMYALKFGSANTGTIEYYYDATRVA